VRSSNSIAGAARTAPDASLATLDAMARMARQTGLVVHVVVPRDPHVVEYAREVARAAGLSVSVDVMAFSVRVSLKP
jgi:DNA-binding IclR family transcriptional regulator